MRVFLPITLTELADPAGPSGRQARAVTPALHTALGGGADEETAEFAALVLAAEDSLALLTEADPARRVVAAADVPEAQVQAGDEVARVSVPAVVWSQVVSFHADENDDGVRALVTAARRGEPDAQAQVAELDLLWYDVTERAALAAEG
ncbi:DUF6912 family protein [Ruania zhangjianzhongii]|uniref:DUF6912 family protein n=1 Tax=Ruania zhangjianzhongii TaxID=2603206 RepID=UPI0011CB3248|nr:hypothetical protein [Ruania zhangjianzhongii]